MRGRVEAKFKLKILALYLAKLLLDPKFKLFKNLST